MNIAFYAPMKSPNHHRPSGDRRIGRLLIKALQFSGHKVEVMSDLRAWEGRGDSFVQQQICENAMAEADQIIKNLNSRADGIKPQLWFTYHLYHKAPDWIGARVAEALNIPYVVVEASYAAKQQDGPWSDGCHQVLKALKQCAAIICLNPKDVQGLVKLLGNAKKIHSLQPFIDTDNIELGNRSHTRQQLGIQHQLDPEIPWLVTVAMMRNDVKLVSYKQLTKIVKSLHTPYQLLLVGDGDARPQVESLFSAELKSYTRFLGQLNQSQTLETLVACDLFVWPAVNEAIAMAVLEAQACGLPVVAGASGAIPEIVADGESGLLYACDDTVAMVDGVRLLLSDTLVREKFSKAGIKNVANAHSLQAAGVWLEQCLSDITK